MGLRPCSVLVWTLTLTVTGSIVMPVATVATPLPEADVSQTNTKKQDDAGRSLLPIPINPEVYFVAIGVSDDMYSLYGHAAILVKKSDQTIEEGLLYNFGVTSFNEDNYIQRFIGGRVNFWANAKPYGTQLARWRRADRTVTRYPIQLEAQTKRRLIKDLERAVLPENKDFLYDTFRANCATKIRDFLNDHTQGELRMALSAENEMRTFRDDVRIAYSNQLAYLLATELVAGFELDRPRTTWQLSYRPEELESALKKTTLSTGQRLLGAPQVDSKREANDPRDGWPFVGVAFILLLSGLMVIAAVLVRHLGQRAQAIVASIWIVGSVGFGGLLLWVGQTSDWPEMQHNPLVWMFLPFDLLLLGPLWFPKKISSAWVSLYLMMRLSVGSVILFSSPMALEFSTPFAPKVLNLAGLGFLWRVCVKKTQRTNPDDTQHLAAP